MKSFFVAAATAALIAGSAGSALAGPHDHGHGPGPGPSGHPGWGQDYGGGHHWKSGQRMGYNDWNHGQQVDWRARHLRTPPRGYEWREVNGQYVLAAVATGLIASIILNAGH
jgi:Ni/Co efflux regulator RcnB